MLLYYLVPILEVNLSNTPHRSQFDGPPNIWSARGICWNKTLGLTQNVSIKVDILRRSFIYSLHNNNFLSHTNYLAQIKYL
jgi:hypothetical protein